MDNVEAFHPYASAIVAALRKEGVWCARCSPFPFGRPASRDEESLLAALRACGWNGSEPLHLEFQDPHGEWVKMIFAADDAIEPRADAAREHFRKLH